MKQEEETQPFSEEVQNLRKQIDMQEAISKNVCSQYSGTICVDLDTDTYRYVDVQETNFMKKIPESGSYGEFIERYCNDFVYPQDKQSVMKHLQFSDFERNAAEEYGYKRRYIQYRRLYDEHYEWVELMLSRKIVGPRILILALRNINDETKRQFRQERMLRRQNDLISNSYWKTVDLMASLLEHRSLESGGHIRRIKSYVKLILDYAAPLYPEQQLDDRKKEIIVNLSALHDIGKIGISDAILQKPGRLTAAEYEIMKTHTNLGAEIAKMIPNVSGGPVYAEMSYEICRFHHERYDGKGYPAGLLGEDIPFCAQVVGIADVYDALTSERVYKPAYSREKATQMIFHGDCGAFSDRLLRAFENAVGGGIFTL